MAEKGKICHFALLIVLICCRDQGLSLSSVGESSREDDETNENQECFDYDRNQHLYHDESHIASEQFIRTQEIGTSAELISNWEDEIFDDLREDEIRAGSTTESSIQNIGMPHSFAMVCYRLPCLACIRFDLSTLSNLRREWTTTKNRYPSYQADRILGGGEEGVGGMWGLSYSSRVSYLVHAMIA